MVFLHYEKIKEGVEIKLTICRIMFGIINVSEFLLLSSLFMVILLEDYIIMIEQTQLLHSYITSY
jgi:hypothetical protein